MGENSEKNFKTFANDCQRQMLSGCSNESNAMELNKTKSRSFDKNDKKVKRPMNAFMLWSKQRRHEISLKDPTLHNAQISKLLGEEWKYLSHQEKSPYIEESQKLMVKHKEEHPEYRYKPRQNKLSKTLKSFTTYPTSMVIPINNSVRKDPNRYHPYIEGIPNFAYRNNSMCRIPGCYESSISYYHKKYDKNYPYYIKRYYDVHSPCLCCSSPPSSSTTPRAQIGKHFAKNTTLFSVESIMSSEKL